MFDCQRDSESESREGTCSWAADILDQVRGAPKAQPPTRAAWRRRVAGVGFDIFPRPPSLDTGEAAARQWH
eukprot:13013355-Heterocapsa_arctica.AAC.1